MNQIIRHSRRCRLLPFPKSYHTTSLHPASPSAYVSGVTPDQISNDPALAAYYAANFASWQSDPDILIKQDEAVQTVQQEQVDEHAPIVPAEYASRNIRPLVAYARLPGIEEGSRNCHKLRYPYQTNLPDIDYFPLIPGIVHGSDPTRNIVSVDPASKLLVKTPWFEIQRELDRHHRSFQSRVYALTIYSHDDCDVSYHKSRQNVAPPEYRVCQDSMTITEIPPPPSPTLPKRTALVENMLVIPADLQMHPIDNMAFCLNFVRYHPNKPIRLPIRTINEEESPAMKRGGFLAFANRYIECLVDGDAAIPEFIPLECTGLRQKDVVRRDRLILPEGVRVHPRVGGDYLVGSVFGAKGGGGVAEEGEEGEKK